jgi:hypothetical protein
MEPKPRTGLRNRRAWNIANMEAARRNLSKYSEESARIRRGLVDKYGEDLVELSLVYKKREGGLTRWRREVGCRRVEDLIPDYASELVRQISDQPEEDRGSWLAGYLTDMESLR